MTTKLGSAAAPADEAAAVTKSDTATLSPVPRGLYIGTGGDLVVDMAVTGTALTFKGVPAGTVLPIAVARVRTASAAADIVALY